MQVLFKLQVIKPNVIQEKCNKETIHVEKQFTLLLLLIVSFASTDIKLIHTALLPRVKIPLQV